MGMTGPVHLTGYIDVPADKRDMISPFLARHIALTQAETGCVRFSVDPDPKVAGRYTVVETFRDRAAFEAHQARSKASDWGRLTQGFARAYEIVEDHT